MIQISLIEHRNEKRIKIDSRLSKCILAKVKQIEGRKWSQTLRSWHIPYTKKAYNQLLKLIGKENISILKNEKPINLTKTEGQAEAPTLVSDNKKQLFPQFINKKTKSGFERKTVINKKLIINQLNSNTLIAYVPYSMQNWVNIIRKIDGRKWNSEEKYWELPYVQDTIQQLLQVNSVHFNFNINPNIPESWIMAYPAEKVKKQGRKKAKRVLNEYQKRAVTALEETLMLERKSETTIKCYRTHLINFWLFYPTTLPSQITNEQIKKYFIHKIKHDKIKETTQGQILNSLVAFYKRVLNQEGKLVNIIRPKKPKQLPNILSKGEIVRFMKSIDNLKHKTMMLLIYSAGLRRGEIIKLRKRDILFSRKCIFVKAAKGKKDRYVFLSDKILKYLKPYLNEYQPKFWLFEGLNAGQYSATSIQKVFTAAKLKSNVNPYITLHGLRHSFATHSVEKNIPLHTVKDLLGHNSIKTTEVYLHISDKYRRELTSPLDDLDL